MTTQPETRVQTQPQTQPAAESDRGKRDYKFYVVASGKADSRGRLDVVISLLNYGKCPVLIGSLCSYELVVPEDGLVREGTLSGAVDMQYDLLLNMRRGENVPRWGTMHRWSLLLSDWRLKKSPVGWLKVKFAVLVPVWSRDTGDYTYRQDIVSAEGRIDIEASASSQKGE